MNGELMRVRLELRNLSAFFKKSGQLRLTHYNIVSGASNVALCSLGMFDDASNNLPPYPFVYVLGTWHDVENLLNRYHEKLEKVTPAPPTSNQSMKPVSSLSVVNGPIPMRVQHVCHDTLPWLISFSLDPCVVSPSEP